MLGISKEDALEYFNIQNELELKKLYDKANQQRIKFFKNKAVACSIISARTGGCSENCAFCAQSKHSSANVEFFPIVTEEEIFKAAQVAEKNKACHFGIVTSGRSINEEKDLKIICNAIKKICSELTIKPCASLGLLSENAFRKLKDAGLTRYHHNLETAESYFENICGTRTYKDQINTVNRARKVGLSVCCGGIFGMGESLEQRVEFLATLRELDIDSIPLNFLNPIKGTKLEDMKDLSPTDCLKIIAIARLMMPERTIKVCGGRETNLGDYQKEIFAAGANGIMVGGYLITAGRSVEEDHNMINSAGLEI